MFKILLSFGLLAGLPARAQIFMEARTYRLEDMHTVPYDHSRWTRTSAKADMERRTVLQNKLKIESEVEKFMGTLSRWSAWSVAPYMTKGLIAPKREGDIISVRGHLYISGVLLIFSAKKFSDAARPLETVKVKVGTRGKSRKIFDARVDRDLLFVVKQNQLAPRLATELRDQIRALNLDSPWDLELNFGAHVLTLSPEERDAVMGGCDELVTGSLNLANQ